ncbi:MAG: hypothetical protein IKI72_03975 [Bacteroidales bacterium]|nr:hypothetical protein [Bacteroidales bacterium]
MPITADTEGIASSMEQQVQRMYQRLIRDELPSIGERCVNKAKEAGDYTDQTGNLRSSVGYVVTVDGHIVDSGGFQQVKEGRQGTGEGRSFAEALAQRYPSGIVLIVVAGMNYAAYVAHRGKDVLASAELLAGQLMAELKRNIGK